MSLSTQTPLRPARRVRLADQVMAILLDAVLDGRFPPGSLLPPERDLAEELDVNRTSLRQAVARLEQMGVLEPRQGRGTLVLDPGGTSDPALLAHLVARDRYRMLAELFEVREAMAWLIGRLAADRSTGPERAQLHDRLLAVAAASSATDRQAAELAFFDQLVRTTRNRALAAMQQFVDRSYGDAAELFVDAFADGPLVVAGLERILAAIDAGDRQEASDAVSAYAAASAERMLASARRRTRGQARPTTRGAR